MEIRKTTLEDLDAVMSIYDNARRFMQRTGNPNQWINGYPQLELIQNDIRIGHSYVCEDCDQIVGVFYFIQGVEKAYLKIFEGDWLNDEPYGVVHRIASASNKKGVASYCLDWCFSKCRNVRIDTHRDNVVMQNLLTKNGFSRCGIIYYEDGNERVAYQKILLNQARTEAE